jgi:predicted SprT family Zn-dependent metalloprotease
MIGQYVKKWQMSLGLASWRIDQYHHKDSSYFQSDNDFVTRAEVFADWRYLKANIHFNLCEMKHLPVDEIERIVVHELCHILVNEMRSSGIDHEERVVTGLTDAFMDGGAHDKVT